MAGMQIAQLEAFQQHGYLRLEAFHPRKKMQDIKRHILDDLKRLKAWTPGKGLPSQIRTLPMFQQIGKLSAMVKVPGLHEALMTPELRADMARLAGRALPAQEGTQLLLSPPHQGAWTLERLNWHVDVTARPPDRLPGVQAFMLIDDVAPQGGGTLVLAGSHKAHARPGAPASLREALKQIAPPALKTRLEALGVSIVEMSGQAGDVYLMDMRLLHTPSINATKHLRMMATARCLLG
jgi:hypothetical protein